MDGFDKYGELYEYVYRMLTIKKAEFNHFTLDVCVCLCYGVLSFVCNEYVIKIIERTAIRENEMLFFTNIDRRLV